MSGAFAHGGSGSANAGWSGKRETNTRMLRDGIFHLQWCDLIRLSLPGKGFRHTVP